MKKSIIFLFVFVLFLTGCEKAEQIVASAEVFEISDGVTHDGVEVGDGKEEFIEAYSSYVIQAAYTDVDSSYLVMSINEIPYEDNISTLIANFLLMKSRCLRRISVMKMRSKIQNYMSC